MRLREMLILPLYLVVVVFVFPLFIFLLFAIPRLSDLKQQTVLQQGIYEKLIQIKDLRVEISQNLLWLEFRGGRFFADQIKRLSDREQEVLKDLTHIQSQRPQLSTLISEYAELENRLRLARNDLARSMIVGQRENRWSLFNAGRILNTFVDARGADILEYVNQDIQGLSDRLEEIYRLVTNISIGIVSLVLIIVFIQLFVVNRLLLKPLNNILSGVRKVTSGDLNPLMKEYIANHELNELMASFLRMTRSLRENKEQQDLFTAVAAHDLREPLGAIVSYADLIELERESFSFEDAREALPRIRRNAVSGLDMVTNLLELARSSAQGLRRELIDLNSLFLETVLELEFQIRNNKATIDASELGEVQGDSTQLRSLFRNLITNALKYRDHERPLVLTIFRVDVDNGNFEIHFKDNGIGFNQDEFESFLQPFTGSGVKRFRNRSFGLGLAVCKRVALNHNGRLTARSKIGEGSDFIVKLPNLSV